MVILKGKCIKIKVTLAGARIVILKATSLLVARIGAPYGEEPTL